VADQDFLMLGSWIAAALRSATPLLVVMLGETLTQRTRVDLKVGPIEAAFDGDFPQAGDAVDEFIRLID
jgi:hypothetical protein